MNATFSLYLEEGKDSRHIATIFAYFYRVLLAPRILY